MNAIFLPRERRILVRREYVANDPWARYFLQDLIAEELSHALGYEISQPLSQISDGSLSFGPMRRKRLF
ncbi:MAG: hypothetical protein ACPLXP_02845 [Microgenomates group bacterium]